MKQVLNKFRIEKEEELEWKLLRDRIRFFEEFHKKEIEKIKKINKTKKILKNLVKC